MNEVLVITALTSGTAALLVGMAIGMHLGAKSPKPALAPAPTKSVEKPATAAAAVVVDPTQELLESCVKNGNAAMALSVEVGATLSCRFERLGPRSITLLALQTPPRGFEVRTIVCVQFRVATRMYVFIAAINAVNQDKMDLPRIVIDRPAQISDAESRMVFRVPVVKEAGLTAELLIGGVRQISVGVLDISRLGAQVALPPEAADVPLNTSMRVRLTLGEKLAVVDAVVRRAENRQLGLFFPEVLIEGTIMASPELTLIVNELERQWVISRKHGVPPTS